MSNIFYIKRNDTSPVFRAIVKDIDDVIIDVTGATIRFHLRNPDGTNKVDSAGSINSGVAGDIQYAWVAGDTDTVGHYDAEFEITFSGGGIETVPNSSHIKFGYMRI